MESVIDADDCAYRVSLFIWKSLPGEFIVLDAAILTFCAIIGFKFDV